MAVRGPFETVHYTSTRYRRKVWYRQDKPRKRRLPYLMEDRIVKVANGYFVVDPINRFSYFTTSAFAEAYSKALSKFSENVADKAELAVSLAQKKKAVDMIVSRVTQLTRFTQAIRKGRFGDAATELGITLTPKPTKAQEKLWSRRQDKMFKWSKHPLKYPPPRHRPKPSKALSMSDNYLEFHFGWTPLVTDIYKACKTLGDGIPPFTVRGRGSAMGGFIGSSGPVLWEGASVTVKCQILADLMVTNPNVHLMNQLGIVNPLAVLWDVIPWSFVVDWFANLQQFLTAWVGYPGITVDNGAVTYFSDWLNEQRTVFPPYSNETSVKCVRVERSPFSGDPPQPKLVLYSFKGFSPRRGAAAVALLVQQMKSLRSERPPRRPPKGFNISDL